MIWDTYLDGVGGIVRHFSPHSTAGHDSHSARWFFNSTGSRILGSRSAEVEGGGRSRHEDDGHEHEQVFEGRAVFTASALEFAVQAAFSASIVLYRSLVDALSCSSFASSP